MALPDREALVVGMTVVPRLFSRNRMFSLFTDPEMRSARARAAQLRGAVRQLRGASGPTEGLTLVRDATGSVVLTFRVPTVRLHRRMCLTETEASCIAYLCVRAGATVLPCDETDRRRVDDALRRLSSGIDVETADAAGR